MLYRYTLISSSQEGGTLANPLYWCENLGTDKKYLVQAFHPDSMLFIIMPRVNTPVQGMSPILAGRASPLAHSSSPRWPLTFLFSSLKGLSSSQGKSYFKKVFWWKLLCFPHGTSKRIHAARRSFIFFLIFIFFVRWEVDRLLWFHFVRKKNNNKCNSQQSPFFLSFPLPLPPARCCFSF